jgi:hypothetical protein
MRVAKVANSLLTFLLRRRADHSKSSLQGLVGSIFSMIVAVNRASGIYISSP